MNDKYIIRVRPLIKHGHAMPITASQLRLIAANTVRELEEKVRRKANGELPNDEDEVIYEWL
jgi:hypothetical protein